MWEITTRAGQEGHAEAGSVAGIGPGQVCDDAEADPGCDVLGRNRREVIRLTGNGALDEGTALGKYYRYNRKQGIGLICHTMRAGRKTHDS